MEEKKKDDFPKVGCILVSILAIGFAIWTIFNIAEGLYYTITDGGWVWLCVVGGILLFSIISILRHEDPS